MAKYPVTFFYKYYNSLMPVDKAAFKEYVIETCGITESTFYRKVKRPSLFSQLEKKTIAKNYSLTVCQIFG